MSQASSSITINQYRYRCRVCSHTWTYWGCQDQDSPFTPDEADACCPVCHPNMAEPSGETEWHKGILMVCSVCGHSTWNDHDPIYDAVSRRIFQDQKARKMGWTRRSEDSAFLCPDCQ